MKEIRFRQPIFVDGKFESWHYWGYADGGFASPANADLKRLSQQFTGLKDKNDVKIFAGDIFNMWKNGLNSTIVWHKSGWYVKSDSGIKSTYYMLHQRNKQNEIIGNIYENPELLEDK